MMTDIEQGFEVFMDNPFVMSLFGILLYFLLLSGSKITMNPKLTLKQEMKRQMPHILIGVVLSFAMVAYDDDITAEYNAQYDANFVWPWYFYLLGGVWLNIGYQVVVQIPKAVAALISKFWKPK